MAGFKSSGHESVRLQDGTNGSIAHVSECGAQVVLDASLCQLDSGMSYMSHHLVEEDDGIKNKKYTLRVDETEWAPNVRISISNGRDDKLVLVKVYEGPFVGFSPGSSISVFNRNRNETRVTDTTFHQNPTTQDPIDGTLIWEKVIPLNEMCPNIFLDEIRLKTDTDYVIWLSSEKKLDTTINLLWWDLNDEFGNNGD